MTQTQGNDSARATIGKNADDRVNLRGVKVHAFDSAESLMDYADAHPGILVAVNAEKILNANATTLPIINNNIAYCDGSGAVLAARQKGAKDAVKIAGCELWLHIIDRHHADRTFYIVGATPEVHAKTIEGLRQRYPDIRIVGHRDGYIRDDAQRQALIDDVAEKKTGYSIRRHGLA